MVVVYAVPTHAVKNSSWMSRFFKDIIHLEKSSFSLTAGLRAAAFIIAPIILAFVTRQPALFLTAIGAIVITATAKILPTIPSRILLIASQTQRALDLELLPLLPAISSPLFYLELLYLHFLLFGPIQSGRSLVCIRQSFSLLEWVYPVHQYNRQV
jgi:hypothetical protein